MSTVIKHSNRRSISQVRSPETQAERQRPRLSGDSVVVVEALGSSDQEDTDGTVNNTEEFFAVIAPGSLNQENVDSLADDAEDPSTVNDSEPPDQEDADSLVDDAEDLFTVGPWPKPTGPIQELVNDPTYKLDMQSDEWIEVKQSVRDILGYEIFCTGLLGEAMWPIHTGKARIVNGTDDREFEQGNRKLAMLGDSVMRSVLLDVWLRREESVGDLDRRITAILCNSNLEAIAFEEDLDIVMARCIGFVPDGNHILATTVKALVGAVWFDSKKDRAVVRKVLDNLLGTTLEEEHRK